ncbi:MAG TPA: hypothetical protein VFJ58_15605 [Armatimonadota bacterium]|nr:hypothetical protein [Armatimonadota bacterium]
MLILIIVAAGILTFSARIGAHFDSSRALQVLFFAAIGVVACRGAAIGAGVGLALILGFGYRWPPYDLIISSLGIGAAIGVACVPGGIVTGAVISNGISHGKQNGQP